MRTRPKGGHKKVRHGGGHEGGGRKKDSEVVPVGTRLYMPEANFKVRLLTASKRSLFAPVRLRVLSVGTFHHGCNASLI